MAAARWCIASLCLLIGIFTTGTAQAAWLQIKAKHFIVYSDGNAKQAEAFAIKLEKFDFLLRTVTGTKDEDGEPPVLVYTLNGAGEVRAMSGNPNAAGSYDVGARNGIALVNRSTSNGQYDLSALQILFHEYAHHFMLHYFPYAYPAWYIEGFAEFYSTVTFKDDGSIEFGHIPGYRVPTLVRIGLYPLTKLFARNSDKLGSMEGDQYYGTAWLLTHFLRYNEPRMKEFSAYITANATGDDSVNADSFFAGGLKGLEKDLTRYMQARRMNMSVLTPQELPNISVRAEPLDAAHDALLLSDMRLKRPVRKDRMDDIAADVRKIAARFPDNGYAQTMLAEVEARLGNRDAALTIADRAILLDPKMARAWSVKAELLLQRAREKDAPDDWKAALSAIVKGNRADTDDPVPLVLFYRYHVAHGGGAIPQVAYDGLEKAYALLPQNTAYRVMMVSALAHQKKYDGAVNMLIPMMASTHDPRERAYALHIREALLKAKATGRDVSAIAEAAETDEEGGE